MSPRHWGWITAAADTTGRPLVSPVAGQNSPGEFGITNEGIVGTLEGLTVVVGANLPTSDGAGTNEDTIIVSAPRRTCCSNCPAGRRSGCSRKS